MVHKRPGMRRRLSLRDSSLSTGTTKRRMRASSARVGKAAASLVGASGGNVRRLAGSAAATSGSVRRLSASPLKPTQTVAALDAWDEIRAAAARQVAEQSWRSGDLHDFGIDSYLRSEVLDHQTLACGLSNSIGGKLVANQANDGGVDYNAILLSAFRADPQICDAVAADMQRFKVVDPATTDLLSVYLFYKGVQAVACARVAHHFWTTRGSSGKLIAKLLQSETADVFGVDIHPGCVIGRGVTVDHATGVTLGETCVIGDNVYLMHDVTLGATGTSKDFDRHPKVRDNVFLGAKSTVLGNVEIGEGATIAAAALVNKPVPAGHTAVGVPARIIAPKVQALPLDPGMAK